MLKTTSLALAVLLFLLGSSSLFGAEIRTPFATIEYEKVADLKKFNRKVRLGSFSAFFGGSDSLSLEEDVREKLIRINGRVQEILDMAPKNLSYRVRLHPSQKGVQQAYRKIYGGEVDYIAFYSPLLKTIHISVRDASLTVFAHELAHVVIDYYFNNAPPSKIHEVLAQYVEEEIGD